MSDIRYDEKQNVLTWHDNVYATAKDPIEPYHGACFYLDVSERRISYAVPVRKMFYFNDATRRPGESYERFYERMKYESWAWMI